MKTPQTPQAIREATVRHRESAARLDVVRADSQKREFLLAKTFDRAYKTERRGVRAAGSFELWFDSFAERVSRGVLPVDAADGCRGRSFCPGRRCSTRFRKHQNLGSDI